MGWNFYFAILYVKIFNWGTNQWIANKIPIESFFFVTRTWIINLEVLFLAEVLGKNPRVGALKKLLFCCFWTLFGITSSFFFLTQNLRFKFVSKLLRERLLCSRHAHTWKTYVKSSSIAMRQFFFSWECKKWRNHLMISLRDFVPATFILP